VHPAAWIVWATGVGIAAFVTTNPLYLLILIAASWFVSTAQRVPGPTNRSFRMFLIAGVLTLVVRTALVVAGTIDAPSIAFAALEGLHLATILIVFGAFNTVTDPYGIVRLAPRRFHEPALAAALALSIAPRTVAGVQRVLEAQRLRGITTTALRALPALAVPVLASGMDESLTLAESMDARGHGRGRRTRYRPQRWTGGAALTAAAGVIAAAGFIWASVARTGELHPATDPLAWPAASLALVAVAVSAAIPGIVPRPRPRRASADAGEEPR
jgi:energy-coupling factor transport system permease protein